jgi:hypothetical protein
LAAQTADVNALIFADLDGIKAGRLPAHSMNAGRSHFDVSPISEQTAEEPFRNRAAANVTGADKEDVFHDSSGSSERVFNVELNVSKSIWRDS